MLVNYCCSIAFILPYATLLFTSDALRATLKISMGAEKPENGAKKRAILFISVGVITIAASIFLWLLVGITVEAPEYQSEEASQEVPVESEATRN